MRQLSLIVDATGPSMDLFSWAQISFLLVILLGAILPFQPSNYLHSCLPLAIFKDMLAVYSKDLP